MSAPDQPTVFLQVYSGQPDPSWALEGEVLQAVVERLRAARAQKTSERVPPPVLGYRGFRIASPAANDLPETATVWRGVIVALVGEKTETWSDEADLEGLLLEDARQRGHGELLEAAGAPAPRTR
jgi:hypothetical protein